MLKNQLICRALLCLITVGITRNAIGINSLKAPKEAQKNWAQKPMEQRFHRAKVGWEVLQKITTQNLFFDANASQLLFGNHLQTDDGSNQSCDKKHPPKCGRLFKDENPN